MRRVAETYVAARAAAILYDEGLAGRLRQGGRDDAADEIGRAARRVGDDDLDRTFRVGGERRAHADERRRRNSRKRASALDEAAPCEARVLVGLFHDPPPSRSGLFSKRPRR